MMTVSYSEYFEGFDDRKWCIGPEDVNISSYCSWFEGWFKSYRGGVVSVMMSQVWRFEWWTLSGCEVTEKKRGHVEVRCNKLQIQTSEWRYLDRRWSSLSLERNGDLSVYVYKYISELASEACFLWPPNTWVCFRRMKIAELLIISDILILKSHIVNEFRLKPGEHLGSINL